MPPCHGIHDSSTCGTILAQFSRAHEVWQASDRTGEPSAGALPMHMYTGLYVILAIAP